MRGCIIMIRSRLTILSFKEDCGENTASRELAGLSAISTPRSTANRGHTDYMPKHTTHRLPFREDGVRSQRAVAQQDYQQR